MMHYDKSFFANQRGTSAESAAAVVPVLLDLFDVTSVVDVGCGVGGWLRAFSDRGVGHILGIDGDYVDRASLAIPTDRFVAMDLPAPEPQGRFDLALSVEVAEHLPETVADAFVDMMTASADVVVFSAAIPYQGGTAHINEQWPSYWARKFADRGFGAYDVVRPRLAGMKNIAYYYRQNILAYCRPGAAPESESPVAPDDVYRLDRVDPEYYEARSRRLEVCMPPPQTLRDALGAVRWSVTHALEVPFKPSG